MLRLPRLLAAHLALASAIAALQQDSSAPRPEDGTATIALFAIRSGSGDAPLSVNFVDRSFGGVTGWAWEFGDGSSSTQQHPTHVYTEAGVYTVRLTVTGPYGTAMLEKPGSVIVRRCTLDSARENRLSPLERGEDFVPVTGDDSLGFYCVYSGKAVAPDNLRIDNNVGMFLFPLASGEVLLFGTGYGDANAFVEPTEDAEYDVRRVDAIIRFCLGRVPAETPVHIVTPHGHMDHLNSDCVRELRQRGYPIAQIAFHTRDATMAKGLPGWTSADKALFRTLRNDTAECQEELLSFASPLGKIWFFLRDGHTPGAIDLVLDVRDDPGNRFVVRGSGEIYGTCPLPGVREAIEPHGNVFFRAPQPKVLALGPASASALGGTEVVVTGEGFRADHAGLPLVFFDDSPASGVVVLADDTLTCAAPPGIPGEVVSVRVQNRNGQALLPGVFSYRALPTLTGLTPVRGWASGGTRVSLSGSGFLASEPGPNQVFFGGVPATAVQVLDDGRLQCTTPPHAAGAVSVTLSNRNGFSRLADAFLYDPAIDVQSVTPLSGSSLGGTRVQITGSAFALGATLPEVFFGSARATSVVRVSDTRIDCTTPAGPSGTSVDVRLNAQNGSDALVAGFRYFVAPKVTGLVPASGSESGGTQITITGSNFAKNAAGASRVTFGGVPATEIVTVSDTTIRCVAPGGAGGTSVDVQVSNANGAGRLDPGYRYHRPPLLVSLAPELGTRAGGTLVTLRGSAFQEVGAGTTTVLFAGAPAVDVALLDDATLTCRTPAADAGGTVDVSLANANGRATLAQAYRYVTRPVLVDMEPRSGPAHGGTSVTIRGAGFLAEGAGEAVVRFGSTVATGVRVLDDSTLSCTSPIGLPGSRVDVEVSNANGSGLLAAAYAYFALPTIGTIWPSEGKQAGGTRVRVVGSGFSGASETIVRFGAADALDVVVLDDRRLDCTTPAGAAGAVDVLVRTLGGTAVLREAYVYGSTRPTITTIAPDHGPSQGGTAVEIRGSNFVGSLAGASTVRFGGVAASSVVAVNDTTLRCVAPAGAPGALVDVSVVNANGSVLVTAGYRYHLQPALASVSPAQGAAPGGTAVTLVGSGFVRDDARDLAVRFGAAQADGIQVLDDATVTCRAPAGAPGTLVDVELSNSNGSALLGSAFRYVAGPSLSSIAPAGGSPLGGTLVTLSGAGFAGAGAPTVSFGTAAATQVVVLSDTTLTCRAPAAAPGAIVDVRLENASGAATLVSGYRYHASPAVAALAPANGPAAGGTTVVVTGSGFRSDVSGANVVTFGGRPARSVVTVDDTRVRAVSPAGTGGASVDLVLSNSNGSVTVRGGYRYNALPTIGALEPPGASALGLVTVTIRGSGFLRDGAGTNTVLFGTLPAGAVSVADDQTLRCVAPAGTAGSDVVVSLANVNGSATAAAPFRYHPAPRIDALVPAFAFSGGGALVEIRGAGWLANGAGPNAVLFGAAPATEVTVVDDGVLRCRVPAGEPGPVLVRVDNANGAATLADGLYYDWEPTLTDLQPGQGSSLGGTEVRLSGGGFATPGAGTPSVRFGSAAATNVRVVDGRSLLCDAPAGPAGTTVAVVLSNAHGATSLSGFRYHPRPTITSVDPTRGPPEGGTLVTLRGTGFVANAAGTPAVRFDASSATGVTVVDDTTVRCIAPAGPARTYARITLANANGTATRADAFLWLRRDPGDLDDDGVADALVSGIDGAYVWFGAPFGLADESTTSADLVLRPSSAGTDFGAQLASGDLNADLVPDLVVGAPRDDAGGTDAGAVFVFFGPLSASATPRTSSSASAVFRGAAAGDLFGTSAVVRDVTGDGLADLLVGAPFHDAGGADGGAVFVYRGSAAFTGQSTGQAAVRLLAASGQDAFGAAMAAGDVTGDALADVIVGAPFQGSSGTGVVHVFRGGPTLANASASSALVRIEGDDSGDALGTSVAAADFDGDGIDDLLLGAPTARSNNVSGGAVYLLRGGATLVSRSADDDSLELNAEGSGDRLGQVLAMGDADGDGRADLLASAPQHDVPSSGCGRAYLLLGGPLQSGSIEERAAMVILGSSSGDQFGAGLGLTDLDGDGLADLLVGAPFENGGGSDSGRVHVFWGSTLQATRSAGADDLTYTGASASLSLGREVGSAR